MTSTQPLSTGTHWRPNERPDKPLKLDVLPPDLQKQAATYHQLIANEWVLLNNARPLPMSLAKELTSYT